MTVVINNVKDYSVSRCLIYNHHLTIIIIIDLSNIVSIHRIITSLIDIEGQIRFRKMKTIISNIDVNEITLNDTPQQKVMMKNARKR